MIDVIEYWESRYRDTWRGSGAGSRGAAAEQKAGYVNDLVKLYGIESIIDWGCGDGVVAALIDVPRYIGLEVSESALELCRQRADGPGREWHLFDGYADPGLKADLALSLDVIFHLVEEDLYQRHLELVFGSASIVCVMSSNRDEAGREHVLHRVFTADIPPGWRTVIKPEHESGIGAWVFKRRKRAT